MSQMVGTQATMNVLLANAVKVVSNEVKSIIYWFIWTITSTHSKVRRSIIGDQEVITIDSKSFATEFGTLKAELEI